MCTLSVAEGVQHVVDGRLVQSWAKSTPAANEKLALYCETMSTLAPFDDEDAQSTTSSESDLSEQLCSDDAHSQLDYFHHTRAWAQRFRSATEPGERSAEEDFGDERLCNRNLASDDMYWGTEEATCIGHSASSCAAGDDWEEFEHNDIRALRPWTRRCGICIEEGTNNIWFGGAAVDEDSLWE